MDLVSSLHVGPFPSWASDEPCVISVHVARSFLKANLRQVCLRSRPNLFIYQITNFGNKFNASLFVNQSFVMNRSVSWTDQIEEYGRHKDGASCVSGLCSFPLDRGG